MIPDGVALTSILSAIIFVAVTTPTVIFGVPVSVCAVLAVPVTLPVTFPVKLPVTFPTKLVAVTTPETLISDGSLEFDKVPEEMFEALIEVIFEPTPLKLDAVIIPEYVALPLELNVTPVPICKVPCGFVVPTPTFDVVEIFPAFVYHPSTAIA